METVDELIELAEAQDPPEGAIGFLERAVRLADSQKDRPAAFRARMALVRAASFSGFPDKAMIHFAWLIGTFDRHPAEFGHQAYYVMWMYKWLLSSSLDNPAFPLNRLRKLQADFERRAQVFGSGAHFAAYHRLSLANHIGDRVGAQRAFLAWRSLPRDSLSDCEACEQNKVMVYYAERGNPAAAVKLGREIIEQGMSCHNVPTVTHANLLLPLLRLDQPEDAHAAHTEGLRLARLDRNFIETIAEHVTYLVAVKELGRALTVWAEHLDLALGLRSPSDLFGFLGASATLWRAQEGQGSVKVLLPRTFALFRKDGAYRPEELAEHFTREAGAMAARFDARNGTDRFARRLEERLRVG
ncbi:hypothetical protein [Deinococcus hopiensis]|uniref:Tetratricopeptide repeat-containing protein n=1 Tax=Deinococcus hopiensis KR-140 TaxID=695939 RepID=A0A1W1VMQ3_9DEIO|nr:hypothetical protein [Deinococcus hopiensis]SMB94637.1 hypothetical protein SAMN00790413_02466 [Deinococcus hopiensis KR-140]